MRIFVAAALLLLAGCAEETVSGYPGYFEADSIVVGAPQGGWITGLSVRRGDRVAAGQVLFALDDTAQTAERDRARAVLAQAEAQALNLGKGRRREELASLDAAVREAEAAANFAQSDYRRLSALRAKGFATVKALEAAKANADAALARAANMRSQAAAARLGGRSDELSAARAAIDAAKAALAAADYALAQRQVRAQVGGIVEDVLRDTGEHAPAGAGVVQILPPGALKVRFFVPGADRARARLGMPVRIQCDACGQPIPGRITFVSARAEFTPPIIYSERSRNALVWMVEAQPDAAASVPAAGQPADIYIVSDAP
jgi:HlyD family secretion protein